ncbi:Mn2+/Fe2- transporter, NRAMP family [Caldisphaera lagunensis DSM 15908]|uniref:Mn2+/Fe2-transporter, NRAMP family n=1 Tax=Caldisphaera lagunensis (strain DSM 15908 / JCM 11604 / ANMR 0165 / IC-154) TaxID=1056495 RepID=L0AAN6_CALLD|nr:divalent metal cation transporter [Caldisphaera lagunensis]AFZ70489.1 Mn2+/Fe2- transporter, NRAMP family [Caldisphaera lagunensis DSM 15908]
MEYKELLKTFGPAWIVMIADVDVASIIEGLQSGIAWGYRMIFIMLILTIPLFFIQDAAGTLGTISGMGLGEAIRKKFGKKQAIIASIPMTITDFLEYVVEYAGIGIGLQLLGIPLIIGLIIIFIFHIAVATSKRYRHAEMFLIPISFILVVATIWIATMFPINSKELLFYGLNPIQPYNNKNYNFLLAASIGAVIMPWMLFFHSGADSRKKIKTENLKYERLETFIGALVSEILMVITVIVGYNLAKIDPNINSDGIINPYTFEKILTSFNTNLLYLLGIGFIASGFLALVVISMASAWGALEALNINKHKWYIIIYSLESLPAILIVLISKNLIYLMLELMVIYTIIVAPPLYYLGRLISDEKIMKGKPIKGVRLKVYWVLSAMVVIGGFIGFISLL